MDAVAGSNLKIARRANAQARADFATWQMMLKLKSEATLSIDAQAVLANYNALRTKGTEETAASAEVIQTLYRRYYLEMGGTGVPPDSDVLQPRLASSPPKPPAEKDGSRDNVTPFRPRAKDSGKNSNSGGSRFGGAFGGDPRKIPAWLIFAALVAIVVLIKYLLQ